MHSQHRHPFAGLEHLMPSQRPQLFQANFVHPAVNKPDIGRFFVPIHAETPHEIALAVRTAAR